MQFFGSVRKMKNTGWASINLRSPKCGKDPNFHLPEMQLFLKPTSKSLSPPRPPPPAPPPPPQPPPPARGAAGLRGDFGDAAAGVLGAAGAAAAGKGWRESGRELQSRVQSWTPSSGPWPPGSGPPSRGALAQPRRLPDRGGPRRSAPQPGRWGPAVTPRQARCGGRGGSSEPGPSLPASGPAASDEDSLPLSCSPSFPAPVLASLRLALRLSTCAPGVASKG